MTTEEFRQLRKSEPFQPFTLMLRNGRSLRVDYRHQFTLSPSGKVASIDVGSAFAFVDLPEIDQVQLRPVPRRQFQS
jgi:hypothetical protein